MPLPFLVIDGAPYPRHQRDIVYRRLRRRLVGQDLRYGLNQFQELLLGIADDLSEYVLILNPQRKFEQFDQHPNLGDLILILIAKPANHLKQERLDVHGLEVVIVLDVDEQPTRWIFGDGFPLILILNGQILVKLQFPYESMGNKIILDIFFVVRHSEDIGSQHRHAALLQKMKLSEIHRRFL